MEQQGRAEIKRPGIESGALAYSCSARLSPSWPKQNGQDGKQSRGMSAADSWWSTEPDVGRVANGVAARVDRLKAIGNGQVPRVAAAAFRILS